jgi:hypothetical protein
MQGSGIDLALLRFALQHTDSPNLKDTPVRPEDYEWLRAAIASFETDAQKLKKLLELLKKQDGVTEEQKHAALEELQLLVEDLDNATGIHSFTHSFLLASHNLTPHPIN